MRRLGLPTIAAVLLSACGPRAPVGDAGDGESETQGEDTNESAEGEDADTGEPTECPPWPESSMATGLGDTEVQFVDVTATAGLVYAYYPDTWPPHCEVGGEETIKPPCKMEVQAGGAAVGDYDGDGWPDLFATRLDGRNLLFRNSGDGTFVEVGAQVGLDQTFDANGAAWADVDNDGDLDLYVTSMTDMPGGRFYFYRNEGGSFVEAAQEHGLAIADDLPHWGMSIGVGDYDRDGWLDLYTTEWWPGGDATEGNMHTRLFHNRGAADPGHYEDETIAAGVSMLMKSPAGLFAFSPSFVDFDEDGWPDLAVTSDLGTSRLFWNRRDGTFVDGTTRAGVSIEKNGMGSTIGDLDGDGHLDWYVTAIHALDDDCGEEPCDGGGNRFYRSVGDRCFEELADEWGIDDGYWGWGTSAFDFDNDGDLDLAQTNGFRVPAGKPGMKFWNHPGRFWRNDGPGEFREIAAEIGVEEPRDGRGLMTFDYDADGDLDLFVIGTDGPRLYRNEGGNQNAWLRIKAVGSVTNSQGIGARVKLWRHEDGPVQVREIGAGAHFLAQEEALAHFGLGPGSEKVARVEVSFPASGTVVELEDLDPRQTLVVEE